MAATVAHSTGGKLQQGQIRLKMCRNSRLAVRAGDEQVRPADEPGKHDYAPCPHDEGLGPDSLHHLLEVPHVRRPDVQQGVGLAGDRAGARHFRMLADGRGDVGR